MKRVLLFIVLIGGALAGAVAGLIAGLLMPIEKRAELSQRFVARCGPMLERMPDG